MSFACLLFLMAFSAHAATSLTHNGITWKFDKDYEVGTFVNGEYWVIGPITIVGISNSLNNPAFTPRKGQNGSMINPKGDQLQGYDDGLDTYRENLNAALPNGKPVSTDNPLILQPKQTLISMVSWLYRSASDREPGCPVGPRPRIRAAGILTCLDKAPPPDSFRPSYCDNDKTVKFSKKDIKFELLPKLAPADNVPAVPNVKRQLERTWVDHVNGWTGDHLHPSEHMPNYGRDMTRIVNTASLLLMLDFDQLPDKPSKEPLLISMLQYGIDLAGIADAGGYWAADGGISMGRKWPILFAGILFNDKHMSNVGQWTTQFQEDQQTFYVTQKVVENTHSAGWMPDKRSIQLLPYEKDHIGMPEWGIRHAQQPCYGKYLDNRCWAATYRDINNACYPGTALAALIMGQKNAWNHDAFFDYADRVMEICDGYALRNANHLASFERSMWHTYRSKFLPNAKSWTDYATCECLAGIGTGNKLPPSPETKGNRK